MTVQGAGAAGYPAAILYASPASNAWRPGMARDVDPALLDIQVTKTKHVYKISVTSSRARILYAGPPERC